MTLATAAGEILIERKGNLEGKRGVGADVVDIQKTHMKLS